MKSNYSLRLEFTTSTAQYFMKRCCIFQNYSKFYESSVRFPIPKSAEILAPLVIKRPSFLNSKTNSVKMSKIHTISIGM